MNFGDAWMILFPFSFPPTPRKNWTKKKYIYKKKKLNENKHDNVVGYTDVARNQYILKIILSFTFIMM